MKNSKKTHKTLTKLEQGKQTDYKECEEINEQIQEFQKNRQSYYDELKKLPTAFRYWRAVKKFQVTDNEFSQIAWRVMIKTKINLRDKLKENPMTFRVNSGFFFVPFWSFITKIYTNEIIQNFFEFSLQYSYFVRTELTYKKAKTIYEKALHISLLIEPSYSEQPEIKTIYEKALHISLGKVAERKTFPKSLIEFLAFIYGQRGIFDATYLSKYGSGRKVGYRKPDTIRAIELYKQGKSISKISKIIEPKVLSNNKRRLHMANISRNLRRYGYYQKTTFKK